MAIKFFPAGRKNLDKVVDYEGKEKLQEMKTWALDFLETSKVVPPVNELVSP